MGTPNIMPDQNRMYNLWFKYNTREGKSGVDPSDEDLDYDYKSYYQDMIKGLTPYVDPDTDAHYPDTYKLPNHPTFSVESKYYTNPKDQPNVTSWNGQFATGGQIQPVQDITQLYPDIINSVLQQSQQEVYDNPGQRPRQSRRRNFNDLQPEGPKPPQRENIIQRVENPQRTEPTEEEEELPEVDTNEKQVEDDDFLSKFLGSKRSTRTVKNQTTPPSNMSSGDKVSADLLQSHLEKQGIPSHIASGIIGNLFTESGLNTGAKNPSSGALGLGQWLGPRQQALKTFASKDGRNIGDPTLQADFLVNELKTTESKAYKELLKTHTPEEAAASFAKYYERPSDKELSSSLSQRMQVASDVLNTSNMKKNKKEQYALGGVTAGAVPWGALASGGSQILQALLNNPYAGMTNQPLVNKNQMRASSDPYQFAKGGIVVKNYGIGETPEGLTDAQLQALNQFIPYPSNNTVQSPNPAPTQNPEDNYYSQNDNGSFLMNIPRFLKDRTAFSGNIGEDESTNTDRPFGYEGMYGNRDLPYSYHGQSNKMATGGQVPQQQVEVEGNEVAQTPNGNVMQFQGPDHEDGGIPISLPEGTKIYSNRLKVDDKTMQQRKLAREKSLAKMNKMLERTVDPFSKNAVQRVMDINQMQDAQDMQLQEAAKSIYQSPTQGSPNQQDPNQQQQQQMMPQAAMGGSIMKYADGGTIYDEFGTQTFNGQPDVNVPYSDSYLPPIGGATPGLNVNQSMIANPINVPKQSYSNSSSGYNPNNYTTSTNTVGNTIGMAGNLLGAIAPIVNTRNNAAATKPNQNFYQNFGKDALATNDQAQSYVDHQKSNALTDLATQRNAARLNARNSARSIQGITSLDLATDMGANKASNDIYNSYAQQMMGLLGQRSGLQNQRDQFTMSGAHQADIANRQDTDAYFSNMDKDLQSLAGGIQNTGKELNQIQSNDDLLSFINMQGEHVQIQRNKRTGQWEQVPI